MIPLKKLAEEVYAIETGIAHFGKEEIQFVKDHVWATQRKRVRICMHNNIEEKLHEMLVCYVKETYVRPNRHTKDESLHIIHGSADFIFLDEVGNPTCVVPLGESKSGKNFYLRVPKGVYHTLVIRSDIIVIHESISGPFRREDTEFAPWAPEETMKAEVVDYQNNLADIAAGNTPLFV